MKKRRTKKPSQDEVLASLDRVMVRTAVAIEKMGEWLGEIHHELYQLRMDYAPEEEDEIEGRGGGGRESADR